MNRRLDIITQIHKEVAKITNSLDKLQKIAKTIKYKEIKQGLVDYVLLSAYLNYKFAMYIIPLTNESETKDSLGIQFKNIMKDFYKDRENNNE